MGHHKTAYIEGISRNSTLRGHLKTAYSDGTSQNSIKWEVISNTTCLNQRSDEFRVVPLVTHLFAEVLSNLDCDIAGHALSVGVGYVDQCLLQHHRMVVHRRGHRRWPRRRVRCLTRVSHHLNLGVTHACHQQLADLEHHQVRCPIMTHSWHGLSVTQLTQYDSDSTTVTHSWHSPTVTHRWHSATVTHSWDRLTVLHSWHSQTVTQSNSDTQLTQTNSNTQLTQSDSVT